MAAGRFRHVGICKQGLRGNGCGTLRNQLRGPKPPPAQQPTIHPSPARRDFVEKIMCFYCSTKSRNQLRGPKPPPAQQPTIHPSPARRDFVEKIMCFYFSTKSRNQLRGPKPPPAQQPTIHPSPARRDFVEKIMCFDFSTKSDPKPPSHRCIIAVTSAAFRT